MMGKGPGGPDRERRDIMDYRNYLKARKEGLRAYTQAVQSNKDPYLPTLEDRVENLNQLERVELGVISIALDDAVGTVTQGRSYAFANNFMPILEAETEFANKWAVLYESVEEIGVSQSVQALEYMGQYYLKEGNKRVSVMKSMGAEYIEADVTRVMPAKSDDPEIVAYLEYCDFSKRNGLYGIVFTQPGLYRKLDMLTGNPNGGKWSEDDVIDVRALFRKFRSAYREVMKDRKAMPIGDAFMRFLVAFGYREVRDEISDRVTEKVRLMKDEFTLREDQLHLVMEQKEAATPGVIASLFLPQKIRAAFLYTRPTADSAWNYWHDLGRIEAEQRLKGRLETTTRILPSRSAFNDTVDELIREGNQVIFATSPVMLNSCIKPSVEHPEVRILCNSMVAGYSHVRTYYLRFYEAKFLLGMAAGILAKNGKIGYIADFPVYGCCSAINAFALGARMVNPDARVYLEWSSVKLFNGLDPFTDPEIRVICNRDITAPNADSSDYGLYVRENGEIRNMAMMIPKWGVFYSDVIEHVLKGNFNGASDGTSLNYWWGLSSGALDVAFSQRFDKYTRRLVQTFKTAFQAGEFAPFEGELTDNRGVVRCERDRRLSPAEVLCMDYLLDNVEGSFPEIDELVESARPLVKLQGFNGEMKPDVSTTNWNKR